LQSKYHKALKQIELLVKDNTEMKIENNALKNELNNWKNRHEAL